MQRFHQGQLDFFCTIYAVINALTALYGITLTQARALFATILSDISAHQRLWRMTLNNKTDFHWLASHMLLAASKGMSYPLRVFRPFMSDQELPESAGNLALAVAYNDEALAGKILYPENEAACWSAFEEWLPLTGTQPKAGTAKRVAVLRFHRYMHFTDEPVVSHWSVADHHIGGTFYLRDASKEENALYSLDKTAAVFAPEMLSGRQNVHIEPSSVFFVERA